MKDFFLVFILSVLVALCLFMAGFLLSMGWAVAQNLLLQYTS